VLNTAGQADSFHMPPLPVPYRNVAGQILTNVSPVRAVCVDSNGAVEGDPTRPKGGSIGRNGSSILRSSPDPLADASSLAALSRRSSGSKDHEHRLPDGLRSLA
jgi:hypothetical protein